MLIHLFFSSKTYHFSLRTTEVQIKVPYSIVSRHFELVVGVPEEHGAPRLVHQLPRHSEAVFIVKHQPNVLSVQRAA